MSSCASELLEAAIVAFDYANPRAMRALQLIAGVGWLKCTGRHVPHSRFYGIPSQSRAHLYHLVNLTWCSCEDHAFRSDRLQVPCKHLIATRLHVAIVRYQQSFQPILPPPRGSLSP